ncbi:hypothetical protein OSTOST_05196 [Ostertagia ostertagi]
MDEGKIVLVGNESDVLHCGYSHAISDAGKRYPSAVHYTHSMILSQLGVDENVILELLCTSACDVPLKARQLLLENMPAGHDMNSLASYLQSSKQAYSMQGLRLRVDQDKLFEKALMNTKDALLIVCDPRDKELGIGMDENQFVEWMAREKADSQMVEFWMKNEAAKPPALGGNQMGLFQVSEAAIEAKMAKMDRWRQSAMKHKIAQNEYLQQLLLSTGDALLIDCCEGDPMWTCASSEREMQRLLTKPYVGPADLIKWMRNKISHFNTASLSSIVSSNVICFTAESVFHPLYPAEIQVVEGQPLFASPAHFVASQAVKYLGFNTEDTEYVMETESSLECWERLHETIEAKGRGLEREQNVDSKLSSVSGVDVILGTDSPTESLMISEPFDILSPENYTSLWINPLFILAKEKKDADLMNIASWVKIPPRLITIDDTRISEMVEELLKSNGKGSIDLRSVPSEDMRAVFMKLTGMLRATLNEVDTYYNDMQALSVEVNRMQVIRRGLEDTQEREKRPERAAAGRDRFPERMRDKSPIPSLLGMAVGPPSSQSQSSNQRRERDYKIPSRRRSPFGDDRRRRDVDRRPRSPPHRNHDVRTPPRRKPATPPPAPQPKPPKQPRPADRELSDGEILSSDED